MAKWTVPIYELARRYDERVEKALQDATVNLVKRVLDSTPVDTGKFKKNWKLGIGSPGADDVNAAASIKPGQAIYLTNNLTYAVRLEYGYSNQAPAGMIRVSAREFRADLERIAREANNQK